MAMGLIACANLFLMLLAPEAVAIFAPKAYYNAIYVIPPVSMSVFFVFSYDSSQNSNFTSKRQPLSWWLVSRVFAKSCHQLYFHPERQLLRGRIHDTMSDYLIHAAGHYLMMNRVCDRYLDGIRPFRPEDTGALRRPFMAAGDLCCSFTYRSRALRYGLRAVLLVLALIFRNSPEGSCKEPWSMSAKKAKRNKGKKQNS